MLPKVKQQIISKLAGSNSQAISTSATAGDQIDASVKQELERKGAELKDCLSQLVVSIPALLKTYKFFNNSFVFNDKDYLKYLSKEANEVKGLLGVYNIRFWPKQDIKAQETPCLIDTYMFSFLDKRRFDLLKHIFDLLNSNSHSINILN